MNVKTREVKVKAGRAALPVGAGQTELALCGAIRRLLLSLGWDEIGLKSLLLCSGGSLLGL